MSLPPNASVRMPVLRCVTEAYSFFGRTWLTFLPAACAVAAISTISAMLSNSPFLQLGFALISGLAGVAFIAAVLRKHLYDDYTPPIGLALGVDEFRLFAVTIMIALFLLPIAFLFFMFGVAVLISRSGLSEADLESLTQDPEALRDALLSSIAAADIGLAIILAAPLLWLAARFFMVNPATMGESRIAISEAWKWSRGNVWRIMSAMCLAAAPLVLFNVLALTLGQSIIGRSPVVAVATIGLTGIVSGLLRIPLIALSAIIYRGLGRPATAE